MHFTLITITNKIITEHLKILAVKYKRTDSLWLKDNR